MYIYINTIHLDALQCAEVRNRTKALVKKKRLPSLYTPPGGIWAARRHLVASCRVEVSRATVAERGFVGVC